MMSDKKLAVLTEIGAYRLLPREVWIIIAQEMSTKSKINFYKCCVEFSRLIHIDKTSMLFSKVVPVLSNYFSGKELLMSRMVCKTWDQSILNFILTHPSRRPITNNPNHMYEKSSTLDELRILPIQFKRAKEFKKHLKQMKISTCPLPGYAIEVHLGYTNDMFEYIFQGNQWFEQFGIHVVYIKFNVLVSCDNILVMYASMRDWVNVCINLRSFAITGSFVQTKQDSVRILRTLEVQIKVFGLEFGPNIETMLFNFQNPPEVMSNEIFRALEGSVKKLHIRLDQWSKRSVRMFTNVTDLEIENIISIVMLNDFLRSCFPPNAAFNKLKLNLQVTMDWTDILIILRSIFVKELEIQDTSDKSLCSPILTNLFQARLKIESITHLSVFDDLGLTFDFLINFPCLKYLQISPVSYKGAAEKDIEKTFKSHGKRQLDITIREALYANIKPNLHLWLSLTSLTRFVVKKVVKQEKKKYIYVRDISIQRRTRVLVVRH